MLGRKSKRLLRDLAIQRMRWLYERSKEELRRGNKDLARRYIEILLSISRKSNVRVPRYIKRGICRRCNIPLIPGVSASVRIVADGKTSRIVIRCLECGWIHRYPYKPPKSSSKEKGEQK